MLGCNAPIDYEIAVLFEMLGRFLSSLPYLEWKIAAKIFLSIDIVHRLPNGLLQTNFEEALKLSVLSSSFGIPGFCLKFLGINFCF